MNGSTDALVGPATTNVATHKIVDVSVARIGFPREQGCGGHNLPGLTIAALRNVFFYPGSLHRMAAVRGETFDSSYFLSRYAGDRRDAGACGFAFDMHGARTAQCHSAAEFRTGQIKIVTKNPE